MAAELLPSNGSHDCNTYPYLFVVLHTGIFKSSSNSTGVQKYYSKPGINQIWHYMASVVHGQIVAWFYFWVNIFSSQMLNAGKSLKTEYRSGTTQGELISPIGTFLYSVYCCVPLPVICVCVCVPAQQLRKALHHTADKVTSSFRPS